MPEEDDFEWEAKRLAHRVFELKRDLGTDDVAVLGPALREVGEKSGEHYRVIDEAVRMLENGWHKQPIEDAPKLTGEGIASFDPDALLKPSS